LLKPHPLGIFPLLPPQILGLGISLLNLGTYVAIQAFINKKVCVTLLSKTEEEKSIILCVVEQMFLGKYC
jgi:hypothetical protein